MKKLLPLGLLATGIGSQALAQDRPNIIMFLVDDMGWQETSVPFYSEPTPLNERYRTPNMERMAQLGVKFTQAYACAISSPSRASLMSGMNAARHRVTNWTLNYNTKTDAGSSVIELPDWNYNGIQPAATATEHDLDNGTPVTSLPQILHDNGYYTIHCGKAHFGSKETSGADPLTMGFDVNIAGSAAGGPAGYLPPYGNSNYPIPGLEEYESEGLFLTEALTREAIKTMDEFLNNNEENRPFYLYMSHYAIHVPYTDEDTRFSGNYKGKIDPMLGVELNQSEINHAALVEGMDKSLGDIMAYLEKHPDVAKNTILLFMSDNGGQSQGVRQGRANHDQNYPHRAGKGSSYMGGVHEPMMVYWPGVTDSQAGTENANRVMIEDFFPSILEMAGVTDYTTHQVVDGKSFVDLIKDPSIQRDRVNIWHFPNLWGETQDRNEGYGAYSAIMKDKYHLIYFWETQELRLYNIEEDPGEENDLASTEEELVEQLAQELTDSLKAYDAQRPSYKATGQVIPWPNEAVRQPGAGDVVTPSDYIFKYSDENTKYYYRIENNRPETAGGPFYWTLGEHNGYKAIQVKNSSDTNNGHDLADQLFYFEPGSDENHFKMFTVDGMPIDYVEGETRDNWNNGDITPTGTFKYMQYDTENSGEFQLVFSGEQGYYLIKTADDVMLNDRGTANGEAANMKWVINTYNNLQITDPGSQYIFRPAGEGSMADVVEGLWASYSSTGNYVGARSYDQATDAYEAAQNNPSREGLYAMQDAYETGGLIEFDPAEVYRIYNPRAEESMSSISQTLTADGSITGNVITTEEDGESDYGALWRFEGTETDGYKLKNLNADAYFVAGDDVTTLGTADAASVMEIGEGTEATNWTLNVTNSSLTNTYLNGRHYDGPNGNPDSHEIGTWKNGSADAGNLWMMERVRNVTATIGEGGYATLTLPVAVKLPEGLTAYAATGEEEGSLTVKAEAGSAIPANTPVLLGGDPGTYTLAIQNDNSEEPLATGFTGTTMATSLDADVNAYMLGLNESETEAVFTRVAADARSLAANTAYYVGQADTPATLLIKIDSGTTDGIDSIETDGKKASKIYDLSGRRVLKPSKGGVYIKDGQKVILR